ncbi:MULTISPECIES: NUDIX hydrolase [unclassified Pseudoalteromonas]|uniref:NUDIX hydrolase n=1 Tax=unclassified Pseudoalteromonas TaxID=194690 RepID=UPI0015FFBACF|nr:MULTISPECIES: NUDIX hydrolase [unclassified Pseudoalteromonas]MBB1397090.1 NUDIX domain-containing protein [Pseudoalteromonas sp. SG44-8]MBB1408385.1 NUDIX domain-containing protein [Pseudoalteromonas sp. SG44-17]
MRLLKSTVHPSVSASEPRQFTRLTSRAIALKGTDILLMYTARYEDFSLPGGGIDEGESIEQGLIRELQEETGAQNIKVLGEFGLYEEYRPWYKDDFAVIHIKSYCYFCSLDTQLGQAQLEHYEQQNGMVAKWVNIHDAIAHNERTLATSDKQGLSILRETYLLKEIAKHITNY